MKDQHCEGCPFQNKRYVGPSGDPHSAICIIGEAPGKNEEEQGEPFVGGAGKVLNMLLARAGIQRSQVYITNVLKCRPENNDIHTSAAQEALKRCRKKFFKEMYGVSSVVKVPVGNTALRTLGIQHSITRARGALTITPFGKVIPTFHPAYLLRGQWSEYPTCVYDWKKIKRHSESAGFLPTRERFIISPTIENVRKFVGDIITYVSHGTNSATIGLDIETHRGHYMKIPIKTIGIATDSENALVVPFITQSGNYFWKNAEEEIEAIHLIGQLLEHPRVTKVIHNALFDLPVLMNHGFQIGGPIFDTMLAHSLIYYPAPHSLEYLTSVYCDYQPWKLEKEDSDIGIRTYNARDCVVMLMMLDALRSDLADNHLSFVNDIVQGNVLPTAKMMVNGVPVDASRQEEVKTLLNHEVEKLGEECKALSGHRDLNLNSPVQLRKVLFDEMKLKSSVKTAKGNALATGVEVLNRLANRHPDNQFVEKLLVYRKAEKMRSTFADYPVQRDGRVHSQFKMFNVVTGRYSSSEPNLMNIPSGKRDGRSYIRGMYAVRPGRVIVATDLSQAELMTFAILAQDELWLKAFADGLDIHEVNSIGLIGYYDEKYRTFIKNFIYGFIYGSEGGEIERVAPKELIEKISIKKMLGNLALTHPWLFSYREDITKSVTDLQRVVNPFGRIRWYPTKPTKADIRSATNFPIQSTVADTMHLKMQTIDPELNYEKDKIILQLHDGLYIETQEERKDTVAALVKEIMEQPVHAPNGMTFNFKADVSTGRSLSHKEQEAWSAAADRLLVR